MPRNRRSVRSLSWPKGCEKWASRANLSIRPSELASGYAEIDSCPYGGGDEIGFYWPIGREHKKPLVVRYFHETFEFGPFFSSYRKYLKWRKVTNDDSLPMCPDESIDPDSPELLLSKGTSLLKSGDQKRGEAALKQTVERLPEFALAALTLAQHYRRTKQLGKATSFAMRALISPPSFGRIDWAIIPWLRKQKTAPIGFRNNPFWTERQKLNWGYRQKGNGYDIARAAIDAFFDDDQVELGLTLMQSYAEMMYWESDSIKRKLGFDEDDWAAHQEETCQRHLGVSRRVGT